MHDFTSIRPGQHGLSSSSSVDSLTTANKALKVADASLWAASQSVDLARSAIKDHERASEIVYRADTALWAASQALQSAMETIDALQEQEAAVKEQHDGQGSSALMALKRKRGDGEDEEGAVRSAVPAEPVPENDCGPFPGGQVYASIIHARSTGCGLSKWEGDLRRHVIEGGPRKVQRVYFEEVKPGSIADFVEVIPCLGGPQGQVLRRVAGMASEWVVAFQEEAQSEENPPLDASEGRVER